MEQQKANIAIMTIITMSCVRDSSFKSLVDYFNVKKSHDIWEGNVIERVI